MGGGVQGLLPEYPRGMREGDQLRLLLVGEASLTYTPRPGGREEMTPPPSEGRV